MENKNINVKRILRLISNFVDDTNEAPRLVDRNSNSESVVVPTNTLQRLVDDLRYELGVADLEEERDEDASGFEEFLDKHLSGLLDGLKEGKMEGNPIDAILKQIKSDSPFKEILEDIVVKANKLVQLDDIDSLKEYLIEEQNFSSHNLLGGLEVLEETFKTVSPKLEEKAFKRFRWSTAQGEGTSIQIGITSNQFNDGKTHFWVKVPEKTNAKG